MQTTPALSDRTVNRLVDEISDLKLQVRNLSRRPQLPSSSIDDGALTITSGGTITGLVGQQYDGTSAYAGLNGPKPPTPNIPTIIATQGGVIVSWDGTFLDPQVGFTSPVVAPVNFSHVEVHVSADPTFAGDPLLSATLVATPISSARGGDVTVLRPGGTVLYARLITRDKAGNYSNASQMAGPATASLVVSADMLDGCVGTSKLANLAVVTAKIGSLAVNDAKVSDMSAGKITAGIVTADVQIGGRFTTALTGARVELNSLGLQKFDGSGNLLVSITGATNLVTGIFKTGLSGRRIEIGAGGATGEIDFWSPDGDNGYVLAYSESASVEAIQLAMRPNNVAAGSWNYLWNKLNINSNSAAGTQFSTWHSGSLELMYDASAPNNGSFAIFRTTNKAGVGAVTRARLTIDANNLSYWNDGGTLRFQINEAGNLDYWDGAGHNRLSIGIDFVVHDGGSVERLRIPTLGDLNYTDASARIRFNIGTDFRYNDNAGTLRLMIASAGNLDYWDGGGHIRFSVGTNLVYTEPSGATRLKIDSGGDFNYFDGSGTRNRLNIGTSFIYRDGSNTERLAIDSGLAYWDAGGHNRLLIGASDYLIADSSGHMRFEAQENGNGTTIGDQNGVTRLRAGGDMNFYRSDGTEVCRFPGPAANSVTLSPNGLGLERIQIVTGSSQISARIVLMHSGGDGALIKGFQASGQQTRLEVRDVSDSSFQACFASAFTQNSDERAKANIRGLDPAASPADDLLTKTLALPVRRFHRPQPNGEREIDELGFVAQEVPEDLRRYEDWDDPDSGQAIDLMAAVALNTGALQQFVTETRAEIADLRAEIATLRKGKP